MVYFIIVSSLLCSWRSETAPVFVIILFIFLILFKNRIKLKYIAIYFISCLLFVSFSNYIQINGLNAYKPYGNELYKFVSLAPSICKMYNDNIDFDKEKPLIKIIKSIKNGETDEFYYHDHEQMTKEIADDIFPLFIKCLEKEYKNLYNSRFNSYNEVSALPLFLDSQYKKMKPLIIIFGLKNTMKKL